MAIFGGSGPMSLQYSFDFPGQLKNWHRVQGCSPKVYCFGQQQYQVPAAGLSESSEFPSS